MWVQFTGDIGLNFSRNRNEKNQEPDSNSNFKQWRRRNSICFQDRASLLKDEFAGYLAFGTPLDPRGQLTRIVFHLDRFDRVDIDRFFCRWILAGRPCHATCKNDRNQGTVDR